MYLISSLFVRKLNQDTVVFFDKIKLNDIKINNFYNKILINNFYNYFMNDLLSKNSVIMSNVAKNVLVNLGNWNMFIGVNKIYE